MPKQKKTENGKINVTYYIADKTTTVINLFGRTNYLIYGICLRIKTVIKKAVLPSITKKN